MCKSSTLPFASDFTQYSQKWCLWSLDIKNAFLQAEPLRRDVFSQAPPDGESSDSHRFWKLNAPAYGLIDAPVVFHRALRKYLLNSVFSLAPSDGEPSDSRRFWKLNAPAYGLNDAPAAFHRTLRKYLLNSVESLKAVGLIYKGSSFDPCLYFIFDRNNVAVGVFTTHIDDILGCGVLGILECTRKFLRNALVSSGFGSRIRCM